MYETDISKMNFKQLRDEVQQLRDELSRFKRIYEDSIENLDDSNLSAHLIKEKENMKTEISVSADGVKSLVVKTDEMSEQYSTLSQTADEIKSEVSKVTSDVSDFKSDITQRAESIEASVEQVNGDIGKFKTTINQTSTNITSIVQATYSNPTEVEGFDINNDEYNKVFYDTLSNLYWHYNGSEWESSSNGNFGTVFEQTAGCFKLKGNVKVSGDLVSGGVIQGVTVSSTPNNNKDCVRLNGQNSKIEVVYGGTVVGVLSFCDSPGIGCSLYPSGGGILAISDVTALGSWDFSRCTVTGLGSGGGVAVFG